ncbi:MAG: UbiD family decarboxylase [Chlamydiia bacterium]|nr:UbiD family decarboxylase [Chlamydiia bacterium]
MTAGLSNLRTFISELRQRKEIIDIYHPVDPSLEIAEIHRRVAAADGPALFFHNVKESRFPVVTNLFGSRKRIDIAFQNRPEVVVRDAVHLATRDFPPSPRLLWEKRGLLRSLSRVGIRRKRHSPVLESKMPEPDLEALPMLKSWPLDGGHFITLPLVYTEPPGGGPPNLGMYRVHRYDKNTTGLHWQIGKGGGFHHHQAESMGQDLPVSIFVGGPPALIMSAITPLPENVPELLLCSLLQGQKLRTSKVSEHAYPVVGECEFALLGHAQANERRLEGPFGDHYGYYSWAHDFPIFRCQHIYHRKDAIYPATVVGKPRQEDFYIGDYLQELLSPLFPVVMPGVKDLWSYGETGFHALSAAVVRERYYRECMSSAFRILGEGQLALTKFLMLTDQPVNIRDFKTLLTTVLERFRPETDLFVFSNLSLDTLDYSGPELNKGSRGIMLGIGDPIRRLPQTYTGPMPRHCTAAQAYSPGCLVLEGPSYAELMDPSDCIDKQQMAEWPLVVIVDDIKKALSSDASFLWTTFTRFEPAADIYAARQTVHRHHICYDGPILIDARMKPSYPPEVLPDEDTQRLVAQNWKKYFPEGQEMGDSEAAHVC